MSEISSVLLAETVRTDWLLLLPALVIPTAPPDVAGCTPAIIVDCDNPEAKVVAAGYTVDDVVAAIAAGNDIEVLAVVIFSIRSIPGVNVCAANCHFAVDAGAEFAVSCTLW